MGAAIDCTNSSSETQLKCVTSISLYENTLFSTLPVIQTAAYSSDRWALPLSGTAESSGTTKKAESGDVVF